MKNNTNNNWCVLHGEAMIFPSDLPQDAVEIKPTNKDFHIIADSETTGNHHVIDCKPRVKFFHSASTGATYMRNEESTQVRCVLEKRHDAIPLETGTWEFGIQQEYDHFAQQLNKVRD
jgi:hypothetical protein